MAFSRLELKQSSLDSFFRKVPNGGSAAENANPHPTADAPQVSCSAIDPGSASSFSVSDASSSDAAVEYERARLENIRRNRDFLLNLGISSRVQAPKTDLQRQARRSPRAPPSTSLPLRRSARKRSFAGSSLELKEEEKIEPVEPPAPTYVDSSVLQYTCENASRDLSSILSSSISCYSPVSGFRITGKSLQSRSLTKIYTMDVRRVKDDKVLVAAGGHGGIISVFGVDMIEDDDDAHCEGTTEREIEGPLLSWKASKSWISGVLFLEDNPMLLVSSSNDGGVVIWDVGKQPSLESPSSSPPVVGESKGLHSGGVFSMHHLEDSIVTASKDSSVGISRVGADGQLIVERRISGHHSGVIRGVCFGETKHIIADCGADGRICLLDARLSEPCTLTIESNHQSHINSVEWSPSNSYLILSASKDPTLRLYDIRNSGEPVHELQGHVQSSTRICNQIYKPAFVNNGTMVATPGQGSKKISIYCVDNGNLKSQGMIGYDANLVFFTGEQITQPRIWIAGKQINQLSGVKLGKLDGISGQ